MALSVEKFSIFIHFNKLPLEPTAYKMRARDFFNQGILCEGPEQKENRKKNVYKAVHRRYQRAGK
jgi:hypothetical protein